MIDDQTSSATADGPAAPAHSPNLPADKKRLIALVAVVIVVAVGVGFALSRHSSSKSAGGELTLTAATDPGANAFMPPATSPPPTETQTPPTLQPQGDGTTVETQPLPGDRDGLYGGTDNSAEVDRDKIVDFLRGHPAQAGAFVESLNTDTSMLWSGGRQLTVADIPHYLHELTPGVLRLDTRVTNHGFDGMHSTAVQSVFQAGNAVLVDAHGVPRVRGLNGDPLTAPVALRGEPQITGAPWPGYHSGALARVTPTTAAISDFVLVDVVTGKPFNRPTGTTGASDTAHTQPVAEPQPSTSRSEQSPQGGHQSDVAGTYLRHSVSWVCNGIDARSPDAPLGVTLQGNTVSVFGLSGTLNSDGSFWEDGPWGPYDHATVKGVFTHDSGNWAIRDGTWDDRFCHGTWTATKQ
jgi:hypothetical protein